MKDLYEHLCGHLYEDLSLRAPPLAISGAQARSALSYVAVRKGARKVVRTSVLNGVRKGVRERDMAPRHLSENSKR